MINEIENCITRMNLLFLALEKHNIEVINVKWPTEEENAKLYLQIGLILELSLYTNIVKIINIKYNYKEEIIVNNDDLKEGTENYNKTITKSLIYVIRNM